MSSICPGLSIRGRVRRMSHLVDPQPVAAVADSLAGKPDVLALLRRIDGIRGTCDGEIEKDPALNELRSRHLVRFYSSFRRRKPDYRVHVLSKGDMVLDELDRRAHAEAMKADAAAAGPAPARRSRMPLNRIP